MPGRLGVDKDAWNRKHGRSTILGIFYFFTLDLNKSSEAFCQRGRGRSCHVDGLKTEKAQEPTVESLMTNTFCVIAVLTKLSLFVLL